MARKKVIVRGGGENLYYVSESGGWFYAKKGSVWGSDKDIGKARSLEDALSIIKSHSGQEVEKIEDA